MKAAGPSGDGYDRNKLWLSTAATITRSSASVLSA